MKRSRIDEDVDDSDAQDDAFDDGDDLMARAAEMMDFDDDEEEGDSGSENDEEVEKEQPAKKKQKSNGRKESRSPSADPLQDDVEAVNVLQLQVGEFGLCMQIDN